MIMNFNFIHDVLYFKQNLLFFEIYWRSFLSRLKGASFFFAICVSVCCEIHNICQLVFSYFEILKGVFGFQNLGMKTL